MDSSLGLSVHHCSVPLPAACWLHTQTKVQQKNDCCSSYLTARIIRVFVCVCVCVCVCVFVCFHAPARAPVGIEACRARRNVCWAHLHWRTHQNPILRTMLRCQVSLQGPVSFRIFRRAVEWQLGFTTFLESVLSNSCCLDSFFFLVKLSIKMFQWQAALELQCRSYTGRHCCPCFLPSESTLIAVAALVGATVWFCCNMQRQRTQDAAGAGPCMQNLCMILMHSRLAASIWAE